MNKIRQTNGIVMVIGALSILFSGYSAYLGRPFNDYFFGLFIGLSLFGVAYINNRALKNKDEE